MQRMLFSLIFVLSSCSPFGAKSLVEAIFSSSAFDSISGSASMFTGITSSSISQSVSIQSADWAADAAACTSANASIHSVNTDGTISTTSMMITPVKPDGSFVFNNASASGVVIDSDKVQFVLKVAGCGIEYYKPLLSRSNQDINLASSLIGYTASVPDSGKTKLNEISKSDVANFESSLKQMSAANLTGLIDQVISSGAASTQFQSVFGIIPGKLKEIPPPLWTPSVPGTILENATTTFNVNFSHWNTDYVPAYEWILDGAVVSTTNSFSYTTGRNDQGPKTLVLKMGSASAGVLDLTKPIREQDWTVLVQDTYPALPPILTLTGNNKRNFQLTAVQITTGASFVNCTSFSRLAITESSVIPPIALTGNFPITCTSSGIQNESFTITSGDGAKTLALWALDSAGNVSFVPTSVNFILDQTNPSVSLTNLNAAVQGGSTQSVSYTLTDATAGLGVIKMDYAADGTTFTEIADLSSSSSPYAWTVPVSNTSASKLRMRVTDQAGNLTTTESNAFQVDSTDPVIAITSPAANATGQTGLTVAGTCENGLAVTLSGAGADSPQTTTCSAGNFSLAITFSSSDGSKNITATQTDLAGNVGSSNRNFVRDNTDPAILITGPAVNTAAKNGVYLTGTCEYSASFAAQNTLSLSGTGLSSPSSTSCQSNSTFAVSVLFTAVDGPKNMIISQTDQAGNAGSNNRNFIRDAAAVSLAVSVPANNGHVQSTFTISGTCDSEGGAGNVIITQNAGTTLTGSPVNATCTSGLFSQSVTITTSDGPISVRVSQTDASSTLTNIDLTLTKDTVLPAPTIASPAVSYPAQSSVTMTGQCENGLIINFSGTGIAAADTLSCTDGTSGITCTPSNAALCAYSKSVSMSTTDGTKNIVVSQTDLAGNTGTLNRNFVRDNVAPTLTITSHTNNQLVPGTATLTGTCETGGSNVVISSTALSSAATVACAAGAFNSGLLTLLAPDGVKIFTIAQNDVAGNTGSINLILNRDATAPVLVKLTPNNDASFKTGATLTGTCESGLTVTASGAGITGTPSDTCLASAFSIAVTFSATDGSKAITLTEADSVGNNSTVNFSLIRDNVAPTITQTTIAQNPRYSNTSSITFGGACETGYSVIVTGAESDTRSCTAGAWTFATSKTTDATYTYNFAQTDEAGNIASITNYQWIRDTVNPTPLAWSTPTGGQSYQSQMTVTGTCESGTPIKYGGTGISAEFTQACSGTFSQVIFFSTGDGAKAITISQEDLAGNITSINRSFTLDNVAPLIAQTLRPYPYYANTGTISFGGSCESGLTVNVKLAGSPEGTTACSSSAWTYTTLAQTGQTTYDYTFEQVDAGGNTASAIGRWIRDTTAPTLTITAGASQITASDSVSISGNCESGLPTAIAVTGSATGSVTCSSGTWSYTTPTQTTDGTRTYNFTLLDQAGNSTQVSAIWERLATLPNLTITTATPVINSLNSATIEGACEPGLDIEVRMNAVLENTITCPAGTYSYPVTTQTTDAQRVYQLRQTNAVPVSTTASITWFRDTTAPVFTAAEFKLNNDVTPTPRARVNVALKATDNLTSITHLCLKVDVTTNPVASDSCWTAIDSPAIGLTPSQNLTITNYGYNLPITPGTYSVYAWAKDQANNISGLTNSNAGTLLLDREEIVLSNPIPPTISYAIVGSNDYPANPPSGSDLTVGVGAPVYIKWKVSDDQTLPATPISIFYTTDDINWVSLITNLVNGANGACSINHASTPADDDATGCYYLGTAPVSTYLKFRVIVKDSDGFEAGAATSPLNISTTIRFLAGKTDPGLNLSAKTANFFYRRMSTDMWTPDAQTLTVTRDGVVFFKDALRGILKVDPSDGVVRVFLPLTGATSGNNVNVSGATARYINKIVLDHHQPTQRLWIFDYNLIRRVDLATNIITTVIGGGSDNTDTVANPLDARIDPYDYDFEGWDGWAPFFAAPNGDFYFKAGNDGYFDWLTRPSENKNRVRYFEASSGQIKTWKVGNITSVKGATGNFTDCQIRPVAFSYDKNSSAIVDRIGVMRTHAHWSYCNTYEDQARFVAMDASGNSLIANHPESPRPNEYWWLNDRLRPITGLDGKLYMFDKSELLNGIWRYESSPSFGWTRILGGGPTDFASGTCADGTPATACRSRVADVFVSENSTIYFVDDGRIRTIKGDGTIVTLMGQAQVSISGTPALNAGLSSQINTFRIRNDGGITFGIQFLQQIFEVDPAGSINLIAGNGIIGGASDGVDATTTALNIESPHSSGDRFAMDPETGDIYHHAGSWSIKKLTRSTGTWAPFIGGGTNFWANPSADSSNSIRFDGDCSYGVNLSIYKSPSCWFLPNVYAMGGGKLILHHSSLAYLISNTGYAPHNNMFKLYDVSTKVQTHLMGKSGYNTGTNNPWDGISPVGTALNLADLWSAEFKRFGHPVHVSGDRWLFGRGTYDANTIYDIQPGGTLNLMTTTNSNFKNFAYRQNGVDEYIYYCSTASNSIVRRHRQTGDEVSLSWPVTQMQCTTDSMFYRSSTQSLIFAYKLNNMMGFAEYLDPM